MRPSIPFGKYELIERINIGGMAEIVKARDTSRAGEPIVAVKRILPHLTDDRQFATMFLDESRVLAQLDHDNVIHTFEVGTVDETPYIALEYVFGHDARMLFHRSRRSDAPVPIPIACYIISQVCAGLHYAHEQRDPAGELLGVVHRDVSLQNILLSYDGAVKLTDFGIAMSAQNRARTEAGIVKGKFGYMSPEQIKGEPMDRRSDVFATGICLYELLTSERLFSGDSDYAAVEKVRNVDIALPSTHNRLIPSRLEEVVMRALARHPRDRFQTAHDMRRALLSFMVDAHNECSAADLAAYMREAFADELRKQPTPESSLRSARRERDEGTGLAAFDDLEPVSALSALLPEPQPAPEPALDGGVTELTARADTPSGAPSVPPLVPRAGSIPPPHQSAPPGGDEPLESGDAAGADPFDGAGGVGYGAPAEPYADAEEDVTRQIHVGETFTGVSAPDAEAYSTPEDAASDHTSRALGEPAPLGVPSPFTAAEEEPTNVLPDPTVRLEGRAEPATAPSARASYAMIATIVLGIVAVIAGALYLARGSEPGAIHLMTIPRDAVVEVDGRRLQTSASPFVINDLTPDVEYEIRVSKEGFDAWSTRLRVRSGQTLELPIVTLTPEAEATAADAQPAGATDGPRVRKAATKRQRRAESRTARTHAKAKPSARPRRATKAGGKSRPRVATSAPTKSASTSQKKEKDTDKGEDKASGTLRLNSRPWSQVTIDGRRVGNTPQTDLRLAAGTHTIKLENPEFGLRKTIKVTIQPGKTLTRIVDLQ